MLPLIPTNAAAELVEVLPGDLGAGGRRLIRERFAYWPRSAPQARATGKLNRRWSASPAHPGLASGGVTCAVVG